MADKRRSMVAARRSCRVIALGLATIAILSSCARTPPEAYSSVPVAPATPSEVPPTTAPSTTPTVLPLAAKDVIEKSKAALAGIGSVRTVSRSVGPLLGLKGADSRDPVRREDSTRTIAHVLSGGKHVALSELVENLGYQYDAGPPFRRSNIELVRDATLDIYTRVDTLDSSGNVVTAGEWKHSTSAFPASIETIGGSWTLPYWVTGQIYVDQEPPQMASASEIKNGVQSYRITFPLPDQPTYTTTAVIWIAVATFLPVQSEFTYRFVSDSATSIHAITWSDYGADFGIRAPAGF